MIRDDGAFGVLPTRAEGEEIEGPLPLPWKSEGSGPDGRHFSVSRP